MVIDVARGFRNVSELASQSIGGRKPFLSDSQWNLIKDLFPSPPKSSKGGPTPVTSRDCLEGILWIVKSGARWKDLPERYPSFTTCWRRHAMWSATEAITKAWARLLRRMNGQKKLNWSEAFGDGTFSPAKKGALRLERPRQGEAPRSW